MELKRVFCDLCTGEKKDAGVAYCGGTTSLINHMVLYHPVEWSETQKEARKRNTENEDEKQQNIKNFFKVKPHRWSKSSIKWKETTKMIAKWFVKDTRPAEMVEDEGFRLLMEMLKPEYIVPCANTITKYIEEL